MTRAIYHPVTGQLLLPSDPPVEEPEEDPAIVAEREECARSVENCIDPVPSNDPRVEYGKEVLRFAASMIRERRQASVRQAEYWAEYWKTHDALPSRETP